MTVALTFRSWKLLNVLPWIQKKAFTSRQPAEQRFSSSFDSENNCILSEKKPSKDILLLIYVIGILQQIAARIFWAIHEILVTSVDFLQGKESHRNLVQTAMKAIGELPVEQTVFVGLPDTFFLPNPDANNVTQLRKRLAVSVSWHLVVLHV